MKDNFVDLYNMSCLNGWTMGNIAATAAVRTWLANKQTNRAEGESAWLANKKSGE